MPVGELRLVVLLRRSVALPLMTLGAVAILGILSENVAHATSGHRNTVESRGTAIAIQARNLTINETAKLHQIWRHGAQHQEEGQGVGTLPYLLSINFSAGFTQAKVIFAVHGKGGTIYGEGTPSYHVEGSTAYFKGSLSITQGTGEYAHASGTGLQLTGTLNRHNYALSIAVHGKMSL